MVTDIKRIIAKEVELGFLNVSAKLRGFSWGDYEVVPAF